MVCRAAGRHAQHSLPNRWWCKDLRSQRQLQGAKNMVSFHTTIPLFIYFFLNYPCSCWFSVTAGLRHSFPCLHSLLLLSSSLSVLLPGLPPPHLWRRLFQGFTRVSCDGHRPQGGGLMLPHPTGHGPLCPAWPDLAGLCWEQVPPESFPAISPVSKLACTCAGRARVSRAAEGCMELGWGRSKLWFKNT